MAEDEMNIEIEEKSKKKKKDRKQDELETLKQQNLEAAEKYMRAMAEFDNFRKRTAREKSAMYDEGMQAAVLRFLPVVDNFERAVLLDAKNEAQDARDKGYAMILRQAKDILTGMGVAEIEAVGQPFDPNLHEAVMMAEDSGLEPGTVAEELMKGYTFKDKPIRHSMVKVVS
jgi:molecular chaperone GrpE